jgi:hypothetical protein
MKESDKKAGSGVARDEAASRADRAEIQASTGANATAEEQIRMRAYELYRERGGRVGDDMGDWLRAEQEYREHGSRGAAGPAGQRTSASAASANPS